MWHTLVPVACVEIVLAQHAGTQVQEVHLPMKSEFCSKSLGGCLTEDTTVVLDQNWRWVHNVGGYKNCFDREQWIDKWCPDPETCSQNCALEGVDELGLSTNYGVSVTDGGIQENFEVSGGNVGSRLYVMEDEKTYKMYHLKNREFSFDVELSTLSCGINAALYFVEMEADGGAASSAGGNTAGAKYGTGYCDAQCPGDIKFVGGLGNIDTENPMRVCCAEMDIWESNSLAAAYTPHPCNIESGSKLCDGDACFCDPAGCDFNSYREGVQDFYGPGSEFTLDTSRSFTVVTQFLTDDGTDDGELSEIRRFYVQDGKEIPNSKADLGHDSLTDETCEAQKQHWAEENMFADNGGMKSMGAAMDRGMVLVLSIWDDTAAHMLWLDSTYPINETGPGVERGPCSIDSGDPQQVRRDNPNAYVKWMNIRFGDVGATYPPLPPAPTPPTPPTPVPPAPTPSWCCYGVSSCDQAAMDDCHTDGFCVASRENCEGNCNGIFCSNTTHALV